MVKTKYLIYNILVIVVSIQIILLGYMLLYTRGDFNPLGIDDVLLNNFMLFIRSTGGYIIFMLLPILIILIIQNYGSLKKD